MSENDTLPGPSIDALHRDIAFANTYRLELIRLLMTLSGALLAFTVTFRPELQQVRWSGAMWLGWLGLTVSMIGGMVNMHGWDRYYMSYRDFDHKLKKDITPEEARTRGKEARAAIEGWRHQAMCCQFVGFAVGVAGIAIFATMNIDGKRVPDPVEITQDARRQLASPASHPQSARVQPAR